MEYGSDALVAHSVFSAVHGRVANRSALRLKSLYSGGDPFLVAPPPAMPPAHMGGTAARCSGMSACRLSARSRSNGLGEF